MAIQAQLYSNNAGFPLQELMIDIQSCVNSQRKHHHQQQQQQQQQQLEQRLRQLYNERQRNQTMSFVPNPVDSNHLVSTSMAFNGIHNHKHNNNHPSKPNSHPFTIEFEKQRDEVDQYIVLQNEKLRIMLQEQRKQQVAALLRKVESDAIYVLRQKDEEIAQAEKKRLELEEFLRRLETENQSWQRVAQENEAMVLTLHNTLEQMKERATFNNGIGMASDDAESCIGNGAAMVGEEEEEEEEEETGENRLGHDGGVYGGAGYVEQHQHITRKMMMVCKSCNSRRSCFLFLPCRHLCSCKACEAFLEACPVCRMPKKASIETLIF